MRLSLVVALPLILGFCEDPATDPGEAAAPPVRGLVTITVAETEETTVRRYPGVLEPGEITTLSFEVDGQLQRVDLTVGQRIAAGTILAQLDPETFENTISNREASVAEAQATLTQAEEDLTRSETLLARGAVTQVRRDEDRTEVLQARAQLTQSQRELDNAREDLEDAVLDAPFDGIINSVEAESFTTIRAGDPILSVYDTDAYEVSFSVNFDVVAQLVVGSPATVRLADDPDIALDAVVSELGERAGTVSSFPVVVELTESHPLIKAGMAVEVAFEFQLPAAQGFLIPVSAAIPEGQIPDGEGGPTAITLLEVFVFDEATSTVMRREVTMAGIRENQFLVIDGLTPGERVATAGVSFLREGMEVRLVEGGP